MTATTNIRIPSILAFLACAFLSNVMHAVEAVHLQKPVDGAVLFNRQLDLRGHALGAHRVVILTQCMTREAPWQVAGLIEPEKGGQFATSIQLEDPKYDVGYRVIAVATASGYPTRRVRLGTSFRQPPAGLPHSRVARVTLAGSTRPDAGKDNASERILLPVNGSIVGPSETIVIEGKGDPLPTVLIRANEKGSPWYVQQAVEPVGKGKSAVRVRFGSSLTMPGDRFQVRLAVPRTARQRAAFNPELPLKSLPKGVMYGQPLVVEFDPDKLPTIDIAKLKFEQAADQFTSDMVRLIGPANGDSVPRRAVVSGLHHPTLIPVLLVRTEDDQSTWYVQPPCTIHNGSFQCRVYLGNVGTPAGSRFQVIALLLTPEQAGKMKPGDAMSDLPEETPMSKPLSLVHNGHTE